MTAKADRNRILVLSVPGLLILLSLFFIPVLLILVDAFGWSAGSFSLAEIKGVLSDPYSWRIAGFTLLQASLSTVCSLLLALPGAYLLSHYSFPGKRMVRAILQVPFVLPSILVVLGFVVFFGNSGVLNSLLMSITGSPTPPIRLLYSFKAIILAHTFYNFPIALSLIASYWEHLSDHQELAAATLGTGPVRSFFTITLPRIAPAILSAASLIFLFCFTSFSIILVLGGGPRFTTLEVQIFQLARMQFDLPKAASFALFSLGISLAVLYVYINSGRKLVIEHSQVRRTRGLKELSVLPRVLSLIYCLIVVLLITSPLASIVATSFLKPLSRGGELVFTLDWYRQLFGIGQGSLQFSGALRAIRSTLLIALSTVFVNILIAYSFSSLIAQLGRRGRSWSQMLIMLPMAISSVVIGLGYSLISANLREPRMVYLLIVCAHIVITLPFMIRAILPTYTHAVDRFLPVAMTLGARPFQGYRHVVFPAVLSSTLSGAVFVFAISSGEMHATLMLSGSTISTIPILLYRLIGSYNFHAACALGTVLMILSILLFMAAGSKKEVL